MDKFDVIIVGAGHAGAECAISLRQHGFQGTLLVIGDEDELPYERPPLSKEYLSGDKAFERLHLRPAAFWSEHSVEFMLGRTVTTVDPGRHEIALEDGRRLSYGRLVWAAGGSPRQLQCPGRELAGLHYVRKRADIDLLQSELSSASNIVVVGGGYIGLEAAAVLRKLGKAVTIVELEERVLARVAGEPLSRFFEQVHRDHGVVVRLRCAVECIEGRDGRVAGVRLATGEVLPADIAIVGIGIVANVAPLIAAGASGGNGVLVNDQCRTSLPDVFAIGDCATHTNRFASSPAPIRLESVQNAADQAEVAAKTIVGQAVQYSATPWFWSNQFEVRLQTVGLSQGYTETVLRGSVEERRFALIYLREGKVVALDCVNNAKDFLQGRRLVERGAVCSAEDLANVTLPLKSLAAD
jgi:3-phenylpropionate/trans-cinnamate dioxygenase ferredoxin reductase subunit